MKMNFLILQDYYNSVDDDCGNRNVKCFECCRFNFKTYQCWDDIQKYRRLIFK